MLVIEMLMEYYETNYEFDKIVISPLLINQNYYRIEITKDNKTITELVFNELTSIRSLFT